MGELLSQAASKDSLPLQQSLSGTPGIQDHAAHVQIHADTHGRTSGLGLPSFLENTRVGTKL